FDRPESAATLRNAIYRMLAVMRVYTKAPGKPADYKSPFTLPLGATVEELAEKVHKDLAEKLTHARIWGSGVHDGQSVGRDHLLADKDLVELHGT
ncbi:MAG TPA: TGS domain-containing protein, partial [Planctomycetaceae bacterium]|nr:TGS domain-containing protein [Planctomycetaceae bacterium]